VADKLKISKSNRASALSSLKITLHRYYIYTEKCPIKLPIPLSRSGVHLRM
jgi:hypothetical protein